MLPEDPAQGAVEKIDPVGAIMGVPLGLPPTIVPGKDELAGLDVAWPPCERRDRRAPGVAQGPQVDAGIAGGRGVDKLFEGDPALPGEAKQLFRGWGAAAPIRAGSGRPRGFRFPRIIRRA